VVTIAPLITAERALALLDQVGQGVDHLHTLRFVHGGNECRAYLSDFVGRGETPVIASSLVRWYSTCSAFVSDASRALREKCT